MSPAEGIRKLGFRRWYERELIEGHVYFVTCFLCLIVVAVCLEQIDWRHPWAELPTMLYIAGGIALGLVSLARYQRILLRAERLGSQSVCPRCTAYGALQVREAGLGRDAEAGADNAWLEVRCRKCGHDWRIES